MKLHFWKFSKVVCDRCNAPQCWGKKYDLGEQPKSLQDFLVTLNQMQMPLHELQCKCNLQRAPLGP